MKDSVTHCPKCMVKTKVIETIPHFKYGYPIETKATTVPSVWDAKDDSRNTDRAGG